jgi:hypothetical protein
MGTLLLVTLGVNKLGLNIPTKEYVSLTSMESDSQLVIQQEQ